MGIEPWELTKALGRQELSNPQSSVLILDRLAIVDKLFESIFYRCKTLYPCPIRIERFALFKNLDYSAAVGDAILFFQPILLSPLYSPDS